MGFGIDLYIALLLPGLEGRDMGTDLPPSPTCTGETGTVRDQGVFFPLGGGKRGSKVTDTLWFSHEALKGVRFENYSVHCRPVRI
ncbi:hypothetical protein BR93DRAFT_929210 [Coniochaeta sp. PMI_546]|nr:hypothetical protein BR93DRAFT_929210 [Coniochaeta sp. PMI_546]